MKLRANLVRAALCLAAVLPCLHPYAVSGDVCLKVWPTSVEISAAEGEAVDFIVNVQNEGDEPVYLRVYALDYTIDPNGAYHFSEPGPEAYSCATWLDIDSSNFHLAPGEMRETAVFVRVPDHVEPGEHHSALFFEHSTETGDGTSISIGARVACLLYVTVPGASDEETLASADILQLMLPGWTDGRPVNVGTLIRNTGKVHLTVAARAYFTDFRGNRVGEADLGQAVILPGDDRIMEATWTNPPLFGRTKATVVIGYHNHQEELVNKDASANFQVVPWKLIMAVGLPLIVLGVVAWLVARKFRLRFSMERRGNQ